MMGVFLEANPALSRRRKKHHENREKAREELRKPASRCSDGSVFVNAAGPPTSTHESTDPRGQQQAEASRDVHHRGPAGSERGQKRWTMGHVRRTPMARGGVVFRGVSVA